MNTVNIAIIKMNFDVSKKTIPGVFKETRFGTMSVHKSVSKPRALSVSSKISGALIATLKYNGGYATLSDIEKILALAEDRIAKSGCLNSEAFRLSDERMFKQLFGKNATALNK